MNKHHFCALHTKIRAARYSHGLQLISFRVKLCRPLSLNQIELFQLLGHMSRGGRRVNAVHMLVQPVVDTHHGGLHGPLGDRGSRGASAVIACRLSGCIVSRTPGA